MAICAVLFNPHPREKRELATPHALAVGCEFCRPYHGACLENVVTTEISARMSCMLLVIAKTQGPVLETIWPS